MTDTARTPKPVRSSGTFTLGAGSDGATTVHRLGYGAMQICGPGVWDEPADRAGCIAVLRRAVDMGVDLIDTADSYGPEVSERLIFEALHPYPEGLVIATKAGLTRQGPGSVAPRRPARVPPPAVRAQPPAPRRGAHRPVPAAPHRPQGAGRRAVRPPRRPRVRGQGAPGGPVPGHGGGARGGPGRRAGGVGAEPLQPDQPVVRRRPGPLRGARASGSSRGSRWRRAP